mgnify:CR=1 FL=1
MALAFGHRPYCINHNCYTLVHHNGKRWRPYCDRCHKANSGQGQYAAGVVPFRTGRCSNIDGHLQCRGDRFYCPVDWSQVTDAMQPCTQVDHKSGDKTDNEYSNLEELCDICHKIKSRENGDFAGKAYSQESRTADRERNKVNFEIERHFTAFILE